MVTVTVSRKREQFEDEDCGDEATWTMFITKMLSATFSYQSIIIHTQCYATSQECDYTMHYTRFHLYRYLENSCAPCFFHI